MAKRSDNIEITGDERARLICHHLEEASVHLGMVKQLLPNLGGSTQAVLDKFEQVGRFHKQIYVHYGGHPDA